VGTFVLPNPTILQIFSEGIVLAAKKARDLFAQKGDIENEFYFF